jgi:hypothetical protein
MATISRRPQHYWNSLFTDSNWGRPWHMRPLLHQVSSDQCTWSLYWLNWFMDSSWGKPCELRPLLLPVSSDQCCWSLYWFLYCSPHVCQINTTPSRPLQVLQHAENKLTIFLGICPSSRVEEVSALTHVLSTLDNISTDFPHTLILHITVVIVCTTYFNVKKNFAFCAHSAFIILQDSQIKRWLFP